MQPVGTGIMRKTALIGAAVAGIAVLGAGGALAFIDSGVYDVSARTPHTALVGWAVHQVYEHSMSGRAAAVTVPADLETPEHVQAGARLFATHCTVCHGAPGEPLSAIGKGINPSAPFLLKASRKNHPNEVFWVVDNGVKMTGMPDFSRSLSDQQLWDLAAFLHKDKGISAADYAALVGRPAAQP